MNLPPISDLNLFRPLPPTTSPPLPLIVLFVYSLASETLESRNVCQMGVQGLPQLNQSDYSYPHNLPGTEVREYPGLPHSPSLSEN
jgi:hypothetical protein